MQSELRSLREHIRQAEAGGHRESQLRREYNHMLGSHRRLKGGGDELLPEDEIESDIRDPDCGTDNGRRNMTDEEYILLLKSKPNTNGYKFKLSKYGELHMYSTDSKPQHLGMTIVWRVPPYNFSRSGHELKVYTCDGLIRLQSKKTNEREKDAHLYAWHQMFTKSAFVNSLNLLGVNSFEQWKQRWKV